MLLSRRIMVDAPQSKKYWDPKQMAAMGFVWEIFASLFVPIVLLALAGRWLDARFHTKPILLLVSFPCAIALSYVIIRRKAEELKRQVYPDSSDSNHPNSHP